MKNITVTVDDETYRRARIRAAEQGTSVSRVVRDTLNEYAAQSDAERSRKARHAFYDAIDERMASTTNVVIYPGWRDDLYESARTAPASDAPLS